MPYTMGPHLFIGQDALLVYLGQRHLLFFSIKISLKAPPYEKKMKTAG
jgi:hypothetical protein